MSTTAKITVLGKDYPVRFGMKFQRYFMNHFKISKISDYQKKLGLLEKMETLEAFDTLAVFVISAIRAASKKPLEFDVDDVIDDMAANNIEKTLQVMVDAFAASQPKEVPKAVGKSEKAK